MGRERSGIARIRMQRKQNALRARPCSLRHRLGNGYVGMVTMCLCVSDCDHGAIHIHSRGRAQCGG